MKQTVAERETNTYIMRTFLITYCIFLMITCLFFLLVYVRNKDKPL